VALPTIKWLLERTRKQMAGGLLFRPKKEREKNDVGIS
jgi:hypothetical protein